MAELGLVLTQIGLVLVIGLVGAKILKRLHIPQVLGFILIGLITGIINRNLVSFVNIDTVVQISPTLTTIALGIIGFNIGAELSLSTLKKMIKQP